VWTWAPVEGSTSLTVLVVGALGAEQGGGHGGRVVLRALDGAVEIELGGGVGHGLHLLQTEHLLLLLLLLALLLGVVRGRLLLVTSVRLHVLLLLLVLVVLRLLLLLLARLMVLVPVTSRRLYFLGGCSERLQCHNFWTKPYTQNRACQLNRSASFGL